MTHVLLPYMASPINRPLDMKSPSHLAESPACQQGGSTHTLHVTSKAGQSAGRVALDRPPAAGGPRARLRGALPPRRCMRAAQQCAKSVTCRMWTTSECAWGVSRVRWVTLPYPRGRVAGGVPAGRAASIRAGRTWRASPRWATRGSRPGPHPTVPAPGRAPSPAPAPPWGPAAAHAPVTSQTLVSQPSSLACHSSCAWIHPRQWP